MKKLMLTTLAVLLTSFAVNAQELKDQTQQLNDIQLGNHTAYLAKWDGKGSYAGGIEDRMYYVKSMENYKVLPGSHHKEVYIVINGDKKNPKDQEADMFIPDNVAFPVTYMLRVYEGNNKTRKKVGYYPRTDVYEDTRAVFLNGKIYILENWKDKDNYKLDAVLEYREKPLKGLKMMKEVLKSPKKMKSEKPHQVLQKYLDAATAKQKSYYATWIKKPENAKTIQYLKDLKAATAKALKDYNQAIFDSPEYQRMLAHRRWMDKNANMTVQNNTGRTIWVGSSPEAFITTEIQAGSSKSNISCTSDMYYYYSSSKGSRGTKFHHKKSGCGTTVNIN